MIHLMRQWVIPEKIHTPHRGNRNYPQCDQTFSAVITKRCAEILPNWIFFYQTRANSTFWNFWLGTVIVVTCCTLFGLFHRDSITKPSNNHVNIISNTFLDMKASNINDINRVWNLYFSRYPTGIPCWGRLYKTLNHFFNHYFVVK
jgi:hypothetical protein